MAPRSNWLNGRLLVADPQLHDENFRRSVILVLDHSRDGALGLVVNRPTELDVATVLPAWQPFATQPGRLFRGGPVELDSALGLVALPGRGTRPEGVRLLIGSVGLIDLDSAPEVVVAALAGLRIFAGYAGWSGGQLESEIDEGAWHVVDAEPRDAFSDAPQQLWRNVLRRQRGRLAMLSSYPEDPAMN